MHISDLDQVCYLAERRKNLLEKVNECASTLNVLIGGRYQEAEFIEAARPAVMAILNGELASLETRLKSYGIEFDTPWAPTDNPT